MDDQCAGHGAGARMRAPCGCPANSSTPRRRPATGLPRRRRAEDHPIAPQYPYALVEVSGRAGGVPLASGLRPAGQLDPHLQRLWHARRAPRAPTARCSACSCEQKLAGKPLHGRRRRHADARFPLRDRRGRGVPAGGRDRQDRGSRSGTSVPAIRNRVNRLVELLGGPVVYIPKRPGEPDCTFADISQDQARPRLAAEGDLRRRRRRACWQKSSTGGMRRFGIRNPLLRRRRLVQVLSAARGPHDWIDCNASASYRQPQDQDGRRDLRSAIGPPPRDEESDHVPRRRSTSCIRAMCATCSTPRARRPVLIASLTADRHIDKGQYRPYVPQELRAFNLAALEMVDYVIIDDERDADREHPHHPARLFRQGYEYNATGTLHPRTQEETGGRAILWRRNHLHAGRHRLFVLQPDRDRAAADSATREAG